MKRRVYSALFILLQFFVCSIAIAKYDVITQLTIDDGLPSNEVYFAFTTANRILWICTDNGLVRHDNGSIEIYGENEGLPGRAVFSGEVDDIGNIWLITNRGICMVHGDSIFTPEFNEALINHSNYSLLKDLVILNDGTLFATTVGPNNGFFRIRFNKVEFIEFPDTIDSGCHETIYQLIIQDSLICRGLLMKNHNDHCFDDFRETHLNQYDLNIITNEKLTEGNNQYTLSIQDKRTVLSVRSELFVYQDHNKIKNVIFSDDILYHIQKDEKIYLSIRNNGLIVYDYDCDKTDTLLDIGSYAYFRFLELDKIELCDLDQGYKVVKKSMKESYKLAELSKASIVAKPYMYTDEETMIYSEGKIYIFDSQRDFAIKRVLEVKKEVNSDLKFSKAKYGQNKIYFNHGYIDLTNLEELHYKQEIDPYNRFKQRWVLSNGSSILEKENGIWLFNFDTLRIISKLDHIGRINELAEIESGTILIGSAKGLYKFALKDFSLEHLSNEPFQYLLKLRDAEVLLVNKRNDFFLYKDDKLASLDRVKIDDNHIIFDLRWHETSNSVFIFTNHLTLKYNLTAGKILGDIDYYLPSNRTEILTILDGGYIAYDGRNLEKIELVEYPRDEIRFLSLIDVFEKDVKVDNYNKLLDIGNIDIGEGDELIFKLPLIFKDQYKKIIYRFKSEPGFWLNSEQGLINVSEKEDGDDLIEVAGLTNSFEWNKLRWYKYRKNNSYVSYLNMYLILIVTLIGLITLSFTSFYVHKHDFRLFRKVNEQIISNPYSSQMTPHFFFNSLGSIKGYMKENDTEALAYIDILARQIREVMESMKHDYVIISSELTRLSNYIRIEQYRRPGLFSVVSEIEDNQALEVLMIPPMILQPIVENSIIHAFKEIDSGGLIKIGVRSEGESLIIIVMDNGRGFSSSETQQQDHKSLGLESIRSRLTALSNIEKRKFDLEIESNRENGTTVKVTIPKIYVNEKDESYNSRG